MEAIVLAQEIAADYVVLDDLLARRKAQRLGLSVIGTLGLLLLLEKRSVLSAEEVWQRIQELTSYHGMYLAPQILQQIKNELFNIH